MNRNLLLTIAVILLIVAIVLLVLDKGGAWGATGFGVAAAIFAALATMSGRR